MEGEELSISINFAQKLAYELMNERKGAVVVIDLQDFSIPVAISTPSIVPMILEIFHHHNIKIY